MISAYHFRQVQNIPKDVYLDTNFVFSFVVKPSKSKKDDYQLHRNAERLIKRLVAKKININISLLVLNEIWFILAGYFYDLANGKGAWESEANKGSICKKFSSKLKIATEKLFKIPRLKLIPTKNHEKIAKDALNNIKNYSLLPADALHISIAQSEKIPCIITNDKHFRQIHDPNLIIITF